MRSLLALLVLVPSLVFGAGQPVTINLSSVSLLAFAQATYKNMLSRDFIISPDALALDRKISVSVRDYDADRLPALVEGILAEQGIASQLKDGIYYLRAAVSVAPASFSSVSAPGAPASEKPSAVLARWLRGLMPLLMARFLLGRQTMNLRFMCLSVVALIFWLRSLLPPLGLGQLWWPPVVL